MTPRGKKKPNTKQNPELDVKTNDIHLGDCLKLLPNLPDSCSQLIIADPPYNIGPRFGNKKEWLNSPDWTSWCRKWLEECKRILTDDGSIFVYGIHHYLCYVQCLLYDLGLIYRRQIIWHYENGWGGYSKTLSAHYEPILWFSKSDKFTYHAIREPYKSTERLKHKITKNGKTWKPNPKGRMAGDVWCFPTLAGRRFKDEKVDHPTQKPLSLTDRIVNHFSNEGDLIIIPFCGSGTECVSAIKNNRNFWASEINKEYVSLAKKRLSEIEPKK